MNFLPESIENYITQHSAKEPELLSRLNRETHQKVLQPRMLSGHFQGRVLSLLSKITSPSSILEIGTYTGYSALCLAEGLSMNGLLHTIDNNEELFYLQERYFKASPYQGQIRQYLGEALEVIPEIPGNFDLAFIDADKPNYPGYFRLIIERMNPGGLILSDNVLWNGKVTLPPEKEDESTLALQEYNRMLADDPRLETVILPVRDGLTLSRVK